MAELYIDEYGSTVRYSGGRIVVTDKEDRQIASVRLQEIEAILVCANSAVTSAAMVSLLREGVDMVFLDPDGEYIGRTHGTLPRNVALRAAQHNAASDEGFGLEIARRITGAKLANMCAIILRYARGRDDQALGEFASAIRSAADSAATAASFETLLGLEGTGSREYFGALKLIIQPPFCFDGRNRRPPLDPVNAMLGFTYALLEQVVEGGLYAAALDPYVGLYHREVYGRESLVFDLMEEFRAAVCDSVVITCCNKRMLNPDADFECRDGGVFLNESGRQKVFAAFRARMREEIQPEPGESALSYMRIVHSQARKLAACILSRSAEYRPLRVR